MDIAIVSVLRQTPVENADLQPIVHKIVQHEKDNIKREITAVVKSWLKSLHADVTDECLDNFVINDIGVTEHKSFDCPAGKFTLWWSTDMCVCVKKTSSRVEAGWLSNTVVNDVTISGCFSAAELSDDCISVYRDYITELEVENILDKKMMEDQITEIDTLTELNDKLQSDLNYNKQKFEESADDCTRLRAKIDGLERMNNSDYTCIRDLYTEIAELKRKITDNDREIITLREDAKYAIRTGYVPIHSHLECTPVYDQAIELIKQFDMSTLLTREQRNSLMECKLRAKQSKYVSNE